jgi:hypothetical protein
MSGSNAMLIRETTNPRLTGIHIMHENSFDMDLKPDSSM